MASPTVGITEYCHTTQAATRSLKEETTLATHDHVYIHAAYYELPNLACMHALCPSEELEIWPYQFFYQIETK